MSEPDRKPQPGGAPPAPKKTTEPPKPKIPGQKTTKLPVPGSGPLPKPVGEPMDTRTQAAFNSAYNKAVNKWSFVAQKQNLAIDSIYTEAKKPTKPEVVEDLLVSLAIAAFGGMVGAFASGFAKIIEAEALKGVTKRLGVENGQWFRFGADGRKRVVTASEIKFLETYSAVQARHLGEFSKDAFKDALKTSTGPFVRQGLKSGKSSVDAFFEGEKSATTDSAARAADALENERVATQENDLIDPVAVAEALASAMDQKLAAVEELQKDHTLHSWLQYQAQSRLGTYETGRVKNGEKEVATKLANIPGELGGITPSVEGVVNVDLYPGERLSHEIHGGKLPGLTQAMLSRIEDKPLRELNLPIVYRIVADRYGRGYRAPAGSHHVPEENQFSIRVDESGYLYNFARYPWHRELLARWVSGDPVNPAEVQRGAESIAYLGHVLTLKKIGVVPDKG
jgi:hypothetical protein